MARGVTQLVCGGVVVVLALLGLMWTQMPAGTPLRAVPLAAVLYSFGLWDAWQHWTPERQRPYRPYGDARHQTDVVFGEPPPDAWIITVEDWVIEALAPMGIERRPPMTFREHAAELGRDWHWAVTLEFDDLGRLSRVTFPPLPDKLGDIPPSLASALDALVGQSPPDPVPSLGLRVYLPLTVPEDAR